MPAILGTCDTSEIAAIRRRGYELTLLDEGEVKRLFGRACPTPGPDFHFVLIVLPRSVVDLVLGSEPRLPDSDEPPTLRLTGN